MYTAAYWIEKLSLEAHPEGGFFRQTYRAPIVIDRPSLPPSFKGPRSVCTAIYFLLSGAGFSAFHRLAADEMWHFYAGSTLQVHYIDPEGVLTTIALGPEAQAGEQFQAVVPAGCWFGSRLVQPDTFALAGCTVAPGFDFADFEIADRDALVEQYPQHRAIIEALTR